MLWPRYIFKSWYDQGIYLVLSRLFILEMTGHGSSVFGKHIRLDILQVICENPVCIKVLPLTCLPRYPRRSESMPRESRKKHRFPGWLFTKGFLEGLSESGWEPGARLPAFETDSTPRCSSAAFPLWSDSHTSHVIFSHTFYRDSMPSWPWRQRRAFQRSGRHRGLLKGNGVNWCQTVAGGYFHSAVGGKWKRCVDSSLPRGRSFRYSWKSNGLIWSGTKSSKELWQISPAPLSLSE